MYNKHGTARYKGEIHECLKRFDSRLCNAAGSRNFKGKGQLRLNDSPSLFDYLNFALIVVALVVDSVALSAIVYRLSAYGMSPNKIAALGENLVLLVNLGGLAVLYPAFFRKKIEFSLLERWQTFYLYIYAAWMGVVAFLFPLIFNFH